MVHAIHVYYYERMNEVEYKYSTVSYVFYCIRSSAIFVKLNLGRIKFKGS